MVDSRGGFGYTEIGWYIFAPPDGHFYPAAYRYHHLRVDIEMGYGRFMG
jgi:hypothetical protein